MIATFASLLILQAASAQPQPAPPPSPPNGCTGEHYREFDFWLGEWDVYRAGTETLVAHSLIEKLYAGCAVRENWMPLKGAGGGSLNGYDPQSGGWKQTWIGSSPGPVYFTGGATDGKMVLTGRWKGSGPKGEDGLTRMTYSKLPDGAVRQHGEFSADHGLTWQTTFDLIYRPHKEGP